MSFLGLGRLVSMGCVCGRERVEVGTRSFYVRSLLGEGGFSTVEIVEDVHSHRMFALKRIGCHGDDDERVGRAEAEYMLQVTHPNLVPLELWCVAPGATRHGPSTEVRIVMPLYKRGTLQDELERRAAQGTHIDEDRLLTLLLGICQGVQKLHANWLAHRDLKPHNVLLEEDDTPVLMDFGSMGPAQVEICGSAQAIAMQDMAAERCSMPYRAPELFQVESHCTIDDKIDIWSLGCVTYAMCYKESPFDKVYQRGDSIALAAMAGNVKIPESPVYSEALQDLIQCMLAVSPTERPDINMVLQRITDIQTKLQNRV